MQGRACWSRTLVCNSLVYNEGLQVIRIFIQLFLYAFPILSFRKNASSNAVYISFGNLSQEALQDLNNYFCIGHFPKGVNPHECFLAWLPDFICLQNGFRWSIPLTDETVFICGGVGIGKFDMPCAQEMTGCLQQSVEFLDRFSAIPSDQLKNTDYDFETNVSKFHLSIVIPSSLESMGKRLLC